jgi:PRC-barrel domain
MQQYRETHGNQDFGRRPMPGSIQGRDGDYGAGSSGGGSAEDLYGRTPDIPRGYQRHASYGEHHRSGRSIDVTTPLVLGVGAGVLCGLLIGKPWQSRHERSEADYDIRRSGWSGDNRSYRSSGSSRSGEVEMDETGDLISSSKVEGTAVYDRKGEKLGTVENFMVGKRSGRVNYAVMSFGGLLGMNESYHPLPWNSLTYDTKLGGYVVDLDKDRLSRAPSHRAGEDAFADPGYGRRVNDYWSGPVI